MEAHGHSEGSTKEVVFESLGKDFKGVPLTKTISGKNGFDESVLLIFEANTKPLGPFQGAPIMLWNPLEKGPGFKWIQKIQVN